MIDWELFVTVLLAFLAAKVIGFIAVGVIYGHVQDSIARLNDDISGRLIYLGDEVKQEIRSLDR